MIKPSTMTWVQRALAKTSVVIGDTQPYAAAAAAPLTGMSILVYVFYTCCFTIVRTMSGLACVLGLNSGAHDDVITHDSGDQGTNLFENNNTNKEDLELFRSRYMAIPNFIPEDCKDAVFAMARFLSRNTCEGEPAYKDIVYCINEYPQEEYVDALVCAMAMIRNFYKYNKGGVDIMGTLNYNDNTIKTEIVERTRIDRLVKWRWWARRLKSLQVGHHVHRVATRRVSLQADDNIGHSAGSDKYWLTSDNDMSSTIETAGETAMDRAMCSLRSAYSRSVAGTLAAYETISPHYNDIVLPVAILIYQIYRSNDATDALVAVVGFVDRLSAKDGHVRARVMATWASAYYASHKNMIRTQLQYIKEYFNTVGGLQLQADDYVGTLNAITNGITKNRHLKALVYLSAFSFMGITAAYTGSAPKFNDFSRRALQLSNSIDLTKSETGMTLGLISKAFALCTELCSSFLSDGFKAFWSDDVLVLDQLVKQGKDLLLRARNFQQVWEYKEMVELGVGLGDFEKKYAELEPKYKVYKIGTNIQGYSFNPETNVAMIWRELSIMHGAIKEAHMQYKSVMSSVAFREAPFCIELYGGSSVGKSALTQYLAKMFCMYEDIPPEPKYIYTLNPAQEYLDGYHPWQTVFVLDDVATVREKYLTQGGDPQVTGLIRYINNVALSTNQAALERKDSTPFLSKYVIVTTNKKNLDAAQYVNNAPAIMRRIKWFVTVAVAPEFRTNLGALDTDKCTEWTNQGLGEYPPFWLYKVEECSIDNNNQEMKESWRTIFENADRDVFLEWLCRTTTEHWAKQKTLVKHIDSVTFKMCAECKMPTGCRHASTCSRGGATVQADLMDDVKTVASVMAASTGVATAFFVCACVPKILTRLWQGAVNTFYTVYETCAKFRRTYALINGLACDAIYSYVLFRESISTRWYAIRTVLDVIHYGAQFVAWFYGGVWMGAIVSTLMMSIPPRAAVAHVLSYRTMLQSVSTVGLVALAGGLAYMLAKARRTNSTLKEQQVDELDWSAFETVATWGQGRARPYSGEDLVTTWSSSSKCTGGSSHDGALNRIKRNSFMCLIRSRRDQHATEFDCSRSNGFVYEGGYVVMNAHAFSKHRNRDCELTLAYMEQPCDLGTPSVEKPRNYTMARVASTDMMFDHSRDLVMVRIPAETRSGLKDLIMEPGNTNYNMDPQIIGRNLNVSVMHNAIRYKKIMHNTTYGTADYRLVKSLHYDSTAIFNNGHSGCMILLHSANMMRGEKGFLGICGVHCGVLEVPGGVEGFATLFDSKVMADIKIALDKAVDHRNHSLSALSGGMVDCGVNSAKLHTSVVVEDSIFDLDKGCYGSKPGPTHLKSALSWFEYDTTKGCVSLTVYGSTNSDSRSKQGTKSTYHPSPWSTAMMTVGHHSVLGDLGNNYLPAQVSTDALWKVHQVCLNDLCGGDIRGPDPDALESAISGYVADVIDRVSAAGKDYKWSLIRPLKISEVINGRDGIFDGIVKKTGGGFGYSGPKTKHIIMLPDPIPELVKTGQHWTFDDDVMKSVEEADAMLRKGIDPRFVYTCHLKDEVRSAEKIRDNKIRMICGASIPCTVLMRKYLLGLVLFMLQNPIATESAVGINVESRQWTDLANYLRSKGGDDRYIAGDYKSFDKSQTFPISYASSRVMYLLIEHANNLYNQFSAEDMTAVRTLLVGLCHPNYDFFGTLIRVLGTNPSGHPLTVQKNNIANSLYMRSAFIELAKKYTGVMGSVSAKWYTKAVAQMNYGDDIIAAVSSGYPWFNHDTISLTMRAWGVVFTHADKSTDLGRPYDRFEECSFVKRYWVYDEEVGAYLAPLAPESIVKSLHYYHRGHALSPAQQQVCLIRDAAENALCYGRVKYESVCELLAKLARNANFSEVDFVEATNFTSYDSFIERHKCNSEHNHVFAPPASFEGEPPRLLDDLGDDMKSLLPRVRLQSDDGTNECARFLSAGFFTNPIATQPFVSVIEHSLDESDYNGLSIHISDNPFPHVYYVVCGKKFALIDMPFNMAVRESLVLQMRDSGHDGYIQISRTFVHSGRWGGKAISFPGPASTNVHSYGHWLITRTSAMLPGEDLRVVRVVLNHADRSLSQRDALVVFFYPDYPKNRNSLKRKLDYVDTHEERMPKVGSFNPYGNGQHNYNGVLWPANYNTDVCARGYITRDISSAEMCAMAGWASHVCRPAWAQTMLPVGMLRDVLVFAELYVYYLPLLTILPLVYYVLAPILMILTKRKRGYGVGVRHRLFTITYMLSYPHTLNHMIINIMVVYTIAYCVMILTLRRTFRKNCICIE